jgi:hypothetical protein
MAQAKKKRRGSGQNTLAGFFLKQHQKEEMDSICMPEGSKLMGHTDWGPAGMSVSTFA